MLKKDMYEKKAFRLSLYDVDDSVKEIHDGQFFQLNDQSKWVYADGTRKAYPSLNRRYAGKGFGPQKERLEGRDDVSRSGKIAVLAGNYEVATDQYDKDASFTGGAALYVSTDPAKKGLLTVFDSANAAHLPHLIVGFVTEIPGPNNDQFLRFHGV